MDAFAALIERLDGTPDENAAARVLADYLGRTSDPDRGWALAALIGTAPLQRVGGAALTRLASRLDPVLHGVAKEIVGDAGETIALMWPAPQHGLLFPLTVTEIVAALSAAAPPVSVQRLATSLDALSASARVALLRLATGGLTGMLPVRVAQAALAQMARAPVADVEAAWHADAPPYPALLAWAGGRAPPPAASARAPFRPLAAVRAFEAEDRVALDLAAHAVDRAWDGLRVLAVAHGETRRLYARRGYDVGGRFPELEGALPVDGAFEGVVVMRDVEGRLSRAALESRLASSRRPPATAHGPALVLHDVLAAGEEDLRMLPLRERRLRLAALATRLETDRVVVAPLLAAADWGALDGMRAGARTEGAAGLVLKSWDAPYGEGPDWLEWRCEPHRLAGVLLYIEQGAGELLATVGVWEGDALLPLTKVALEGASADAALAYAAESRVDRFGPVLQVAAGAEQGLVLEVEFASVERAARRRSGVTLHDARLVGIVSDARPSEAARLDDVRTLIR